MCSTPSFSDMPHWYSWSFLTKLLLGITAAWLVYQLDLTSKTQDLLDFIENDLSPLTAASLLAAATVLFSVLFLSTTPFNLSAGAILGVTYGTLIIEAGCIVGAVFCFLLGRYVAKDWAKKQLDASPTLKTLIEAVSEKGFAVVVLSRLSPVFPFAILSYVLGLTQISVLTFMLGTGVGLLPGVALYCWLGLNMKHAAQSKDQGIDPSVWLAVVASIFVIVVVTWQGKRMVDQIQTKRSP